LPTLFANPALAAAALACVALPILIHILFRRKRKPIAFAAMRFLIEALKRQRRRLRLEQILLLALRCLLVLCVALAIGRPLLAQLALVGVAGPRTVVLLLDDSLTATRTTVDRAAWSRTQDRAREILSTLDAARGDRAGVMLMGGDPVPLVMPPTTDIAGVIDATLRHTPVDGPVRFGPSLKRTIDILAAANATGPVEVVALSEWLGGTTRRAFEGIPTLPEGWTLSAVGPSTTPSSNTAITSFRAEAPLLIASDLGGAASLPVSISLSRFGPTVGSADVTTLTVALSPMAGSSERINANSAREAVRWSPGQVTATVNTAIPITRTGGDAPEGVTDWFASAQIETGNDSIAADNQWLLPLTSRNRLEVQIVGRRGDGQGVASFSPVDWYTLALTPDASGTQRRRDGATIRATSQAPETLTTSPINADAVFVADPDRVMPEGWAAVRDAWQSGTLIVVSPPAQATDQRWTDDLAAALDIDLSLARTARDVLPALSLRPLPPGDVTDLFRNLQAEMTELLPAVRVQRVLDAPASPHRPLLQLADPAGTPILLELTPRQPVAGAGRILLFTIAPDLEWGSLVATPLMVPLMQEIVRSGSQRSRLSVLLEAGSTPTLARPATDVRPHRAADGTPATDSATAPNAPFTRAGIADARDAAGQRIAWVGVHPAVSASDTGISELRELESDLAALAPSTTWLEPLSGGAAAPEPETETTEQDPADQPTPASNVISFWLFAAALGLAVLEAMLARIFSHASVIQREEATPA